MNIVGNGYLARHLRSIEYSHPQATVLAAGVPGHNLPDAEHRREFRLVQKQIRHCQATGQTLVFLSTTSMYGTAESLGREDDQVVASTAYGQHKLDLETLIRGSGADHLILRLTQVIGPDEPVSRLIPVLISQLKAGRVRVERYARRDLLYVSDFVAIIDGLLGAGVRNEIINVASGDCVPVTRIVDHLEERFGLVVGREDIPTGVSYCSSVAKLRALVPATAQMDFGADYFQRAIDRYLAEESAA